MGTVCAGIVSGSIAEASWTFEATVGVEESIICVELVSVELHKIGATIQLGSARLPAWLTYTTETEIIFSDFSDDSAAQTVTYRLTLTLEIDTSVAFVTGDEIYTLEICWREEDCVGEEECCYPILKVREPCPGLIPVSTGWTLNFFGQRQPYSTTGWTLAISQNPI